MSSETFQIAMSQMTEELAAAAQRDGLLDTAIMRRMIDPENEGLTLEQRASIHVAAYRFIRAHHDVEDVARAMVRAGCAASVDDLVEGMFQHLAMDILHGEVAAWLDAGYGEPEVLCRVADAIAREGTAPVKRMLGERILEAPSKFADSLLFSPTWRREAATSIARGLGDEALMQLHHHVLSKDTRTRQVTARLLLKQKASHRELAARWLASEDHLVTARFLTEILEEHPSVLAQALSASPIAESIVWCLWRDGNQMPFMDLPPRLALVRDQARSAQAWERLASDLRGSLRNDSAQDPSAAWEAAFRRLASIHVRTSNLLRELPAPSSLVDSLVPEQIFAAAGAITGLAMAMPVGIERRDVPRWSYLAAMLPALAGRLRERRVDLGELLSWEMELDHTRDRLAEALMQAAEETRESARNNESRLLDVLAGFTHDGSALMRRYLMALDELAPAALGRTRADQIAAMASMIDGPLPLDCEGVLGTYHPVDHQIILFPWMIELAATVMGWSAPTLERVAILHEASHAILIDGTGAGSKAWETYDRTPERVHETLACMLAEATARRLGPAPEAELAGTIMELAAPEACLLADFPGGLPSLAGMVREGWFGGISDAALAMARRVLAERCQTTAASAHLLVKVNDLDPWERIILQIAIVQCLVDGPAPRRGSALRLEVEMARKALQAQRMSAIPRIGEWVFPRIADDPAFLRVQALLEGGEVWRDLPARSSK